MLRRLIILIVGILITHSGWAQDDGTHKPSSVIFSGMITSRGLGADLAYTVGNELRQYRFALEARQIRDAHEALIDPANPELGGDTSMESSIPLP